VGSERGGLLGFGVELINVQKDRNLRIFVLFICFSSKAKRKKLKT
jgi:hypothetical protein